ncbi:Mediator of RNA polymerase II transcription subunit 20 [Aphelenchoides besseyi]|nr:Mediator of RNA polymerase II transcription subunit 20 [Aphelenchoides besseyi]
MGVSWVFAVDESQRLVEAALERVGAEQRTSYKVDCTVFKPTSSVAAQLGQFYLLHHSNYPDTSCNFVEVTNSTGPEPNYARATSDQGFDSIMQNFSTAFASDARFEGVVVEFEFAACNVVAQCWSLMCEMVGSFFPSEYKRLPIPLLRQRQAAENYSVSDTLEQYLHIFNEMRKKKP